MTKIEIGEFINRFGIKFGIMLKARNLFCKMLNIFKLHKPIFCDIPFCHSELVSESKITTMSLREQSPKQFIPPSRHCEPPVKYCISRGRGNLIFLFSVLSLQRRATNCVVDRVRVILCLTGF